MKALSFTPGASCSFAASRSSGHRLVPENASISSPTDARYAWMTTETVFSPRSGLFRASYRHEIVLAERKSFAFPWIFSRSSAAIPPIPGRRRSTPPGSRNGCVSDFPAVSYVVLVGRDVGAMPCDSLRMSRDKEAMTHDIEEMTRDARGDDIRH